MIVVSDTSPLNYLILIGHVAVLPKLYGELIIPPAVAAELSQSNSPAAVRDFIASPANWVRIAQAPAPDPDLIALGPGEQQAICLAIQVRADLLLCDDRDAREAAEQRSVKVVGTLAVLDEGADRGLLNFDAALAALRATNFRASPALIARIRRDRSGQ
jgi:predicted nucleic acid-binding protein